MAAVIFAVACAVFVYAVYALTHGAATFTTGILLLAVILACEHVLKRHNTP